MLADALKLMTGEYGKELQQDRESKQALLEESRQRTQSSKDRIDLAQKSEERVRRNQLFMNLVRNKITPEITDMKNRNAPQSEYDSLGDELLEDYPDIMSLYGKKGMRFKKRNKQIEFDMTMNLNAEDLSNYGISENSLAYKSMLQKIKNGGGSASFIISGDESGKLQIDSPGQRHLETIIKDPDATPEDIKQAMDIANNIFKNDTDNGEEADGENLIQKAYNFVANVNSGYPVEQKPPQSQDSDSLPTLVKYNEKTQRVELDTGEQISVIDYEKGVKTGKFKKLTGEPVKKLTGEPVVQSVKERSKVENGV